MQLYLVHSCHIVAPLCWPDRSSLQYSGHMINHLDNWHYLPWFLRDHSYKARSRRCCLYSVQTYSHCTGYNWSLPHSSYTSTSQSFCHTLLNYWLSLPIHIYMTDIPMRQTFQTQNCLPCIHHRPALVRFPYTHTVLLSCRTLSLELSPESCSCTLHSLGQSSGSYQYTHHTGDLWPGPCIDTDRTQGHKTGRSTPGGYTHKENTLGGCLMLGWSNHAYSLHIWLL